MCAHFIWIVLVCPCFSLFRVMYVIFFIQLLCYFIINRVSLSSGPLNAEERDAITICRRISGCAVNRSMPLAEGVILAFQKLVKCSPPVGLIFCLSHIYYNLTIMFGIIPRNKTLNIRKHSNMWTILLWFSIFIDYVRNEKSLKA